MASPDRDPPAPPDEQDAERERRLRRVWGMLQAGGIVFLAIVSLGLLPTIVSSAFPALGAAASVAAWILAPAIGIGLLVVAAMRLRR